MHRFLCPLLVLSFGLLGCSDDESSEPTVQTFEALAPVNSPVTGNWIRPMNGMSWQWQLSGAINADYAVDLYDIDLFDPPDSVLSVLQVRKVLVVAYFSAGSSEDWRSDFGQIPSSAQGLPLDGWEGERWLNIRDPAVWGVMQSRRLA